MLLVWFFSGELMVEKVFGVIDIFWKSVLSVFDENVGIGFD